MQNKKNYKLSASNSLNSLAKLNNNVSKILLSEQDIQAMIKVGNAAQDTHKNWLKHNIDSYNAIIPPASSKKKTLVLDLDETLVHSSFTLVPKFDIIVPVQLDDNIVPVYVSYRPHCIEFLKEMAKYYELVIFTASMAKYAEPLISRIDPDKVIKYNLYRDACVNYNGSFIKDLRTIGRRMEECLIVDNSPICYCLQPENAVPIKSWFDDPHDRELFELSTFLIELSKFHDVRTVLGMVAKDPTASKQQTTSVANLNVVLAYVKTTLNDRIDKVKIAYNIDTDKYGKKDHDKSDDKTEKPISVKGKEKEKERDRDATNYTSSVTLKNVKNHNQPLNPVSHLNHNQTNNSPTITPHKMHENNAIRPESRVSNRSTMNKSKSGSFLEVSQAKTKSNEKDAIALNPTNHYTRENKENYSPVDRKTNMTNVTSIPYRKPNTALHNTLVNKKSSFHEYGEVLANANIYPQLSRKSVSLYKFPSKNAVQVKPNADPQFMRSGSTNSFVNNNNNKNVPTLKPITPVEPLHNSDNEIKGASVTSKNSLKNKSYSQSLLIPIPASIDKDKNDLIKHINHSDIRPKRNLKINNFNVVSQPRDLNLINKNLVSKIRDSRFRQVDRNSELNNYKDLKQAPNQPHVDPLLALRKHKSDMNIIKRRTNNLNVRPEATNQKLVNIRKNYSRSLLNRK